MGEKFFEQTPQADDRILTPEDEAEVQQRNAARDEEQRQRLEKISRELTEQSRRDKVLTPEDEAEVQQRNAARDEAQRQELAEGSRLAAVESAKLKK